MSLIWPKAEATIGTTAPRLHAFVIGVANYPHLNGGRGPLALDPLGLAQITTPRYTCLAIVDWLLTRYQNPRCPLGSVEVLLSPSEFVPSHDRRVYAASAVMANIESAFNAWTKRCRANPDNIAWFYFCGHGVCKGEVQYLLPEDHGNPDLFEWKNTIDFNGMRVGMQGHDPQTQIFFVDACREKPLALAQKENVRGNPLTGVSNDSPVNCTATYYAAKDNREAYGPPDDVSYFGQALLTCLNGVGALEKRHQWVVDTHSLGNALGQIMGPLAHRYHRELGFKPDINGMGHICEVVGPRVIATVSCTSEDANAVADIRISRGTKQLRSVPGQPKPIVEDVEAGDWTIEVTFSDKQFLSAPPKSYPFMPPVFVGVEVP